jgi:hypothetical protein
MSVIKSWRANKRLEVDEISFANIVYDWHLESAKVPFFCFSFQAHLSLSLSLSFLRKVRDNYTSLSFNFKS